MSYKFEKINDIMNLESVKYSICIDEVLSDNNKQDFAFVY